LTREEGRHGQVPEGSAVFARSDWSKAWPDPRLASLNLERRILFYGLKPLDTDSTPNLEG
jgi:hypothetical protein